MKLDVAITTFRRPAMAEIAVRSCLSQGASLNRVIIVDDASDDDTPRRLAALHDDRVLVHVRRANGGIGAARRDALDMSSAPWTVMLDSDHELLPGALRRLAEAASSCDPSVGILGARYRWDTGAVTPRILPACTIDYRLRIEWSSLPNSIGTDYLCCISERVRRSTRWSSERSGLVDMLFQLDAARIANAQFLPDCLAHQKSNGEESYSRGTADQLLRRRRLDANGGVVLCRRILQEHGPALKAWAPKSLATLLKEGAIFAALSGRRFLATYWALRALMLLQAGSMHVGLVPACLAGPELFARAYRKRLIKGGAQDAP